MEDKPKRECSLTEWCSELPPGHRANRELAEILNDNTRLRAALPNDAEMTAITTCVLSLGGAWISDEDRRIAAEWIDRAREALERT